MAETTGDVEAATTKRCPFLGAVPGGLLSIVPQCLHFTAAARISSAQPASVRTTSGGMTLKIIGAVATCVGMLVAMVGASMPSSDWMATAGGVLLLGGIVTFVVGRFQD